MLAAGGRASWNPSVAVLARVTKPCYRARRFVRGGLAAQGRIRRAAREAAVSADRPDGAIGRDGRWPFAVASARTPRTDAPESGRTTSRAGTISGDQHCQE